MRRPIRFLVLPGAWACAMSIAGCGSGTPPPTTAAGDDRSTVEAPAEPTLTAAEGVAPIDAPCSEGVDERCDAVDQNCDGRIDEGCGYEQGALQVTLAWNSDADLDLVVVSPDGARLRSGNAQVPSGGVLDRAVRGACDEETSRDRLENAYWPTDPPPGEYEIAIEYVDGCGEEPPATTATVSISQGGRVRGVYNVALSAPGTTPVATLRL